MNKSITAELQSCIDLCQHCHEICVETLTHCLEKGGDHAEPNHVGLMLDCAEICQTSANFMMRESNLHIEVCRACAAICARCAEDCAKFENDEEMALCAEACRACAAACREMAPV